MTFYLRLRSHNAIAMIATLSQLFKKFNQLRGRRVFILPTRFGILYAAFIFLILLAAINYSNSLGHILCFLLASMGVLAMHYTYNNLAKIEFLSAQADPVFCGQNIQFKLLFDNQSNHDCYLIDVGSKQNSIKSWNPFKNLTGFNYQSHHLIKQLTAQQQQRHIIAISSRKRGKQALGQIRIASRFPFGLFDTWTYFTSHDEAIVYPQAKGELPLPTSNVQGQYTIGEKKKGLDDFSGFNPYRAGDPIHAIAWKAAARDDVLRTKQFSSTLSGNILLSWQDTAQLNDSEDRLSQLCVWIIACEASGLSYALDLPTGFLDYDHGYNHKQQCLTALALYEH